MLVIRTGKPGHGKTLNTIREVDRKALAEGRVVYFHNISGLKPDQLQAQWFEFEDPEKWFELPNDSIIVVDEAQGWFGARDPRARPPEHITRFETMRHQGHEVHLVTQDPRYSMCIFVGCATATFITGESSSRSNCCASSRKSS